MLECKFGDLGVATRLADSDATLETEVTTSMTIASTPLTSSLAAKTPPKPSNPKPKKATALYTFSSLETCDIGFKAGDTVWVEKEDISGWWTGNIQLLILGTVDGKKGAFPGEYVQYI
jgi:hypothetical protein